MLALKRVNENDLIALKDIKARAFEDEFSRCGFVPEDMISLEWHKSMMQKSIYYKILDGANIIGGVNIFKDTQNSRGYLCSLFVDKSLQNKGYGSIVISLLEELHPDVTKWGLETPAMSVQNHYFYEKNGYVHKGDIIPEGAPVGFSLRSYEKVIKEDR